MINRWPVLNEATWAKVEQVIAELGYVPKEDAQALATGRGKLIALLSDSANPQQALAAQQGMLEALRDSDHALVVHAVDRAAPGMEQDLRRFLEAHRPAGALLLPGIAELGSIARACDEIGCAYVRMGATMIDEAAQLVASDDRAAAARAVSHLIALGHRRIGLVAGPEGSAIAQQRELGYLDAIADHDLDRGPALVAAGDFGFTSGLAAGHLLLEVSPRPTAIFAINDAMGAGVLHAARARAILVPDALSVVGFEDTPLAAQLCPPLTTVHLPVAAMARTAAVKLLNPDIAAQQRTQFALELVSRGSAGPAPAQAG